MASLGCALDHGGHDLDVAAFAGVAPAASCAGARGHGARLGALHIDLMKAGARDMRQGEVRILARSRWSNASSAPCQADSMQSTPSR